MVADNPELSVEMRSVLEQRNSTQYSPLPLKPKTMEWNRFRMTPSNFRFSWHPEILASIPISLLADLRIDCGKMHPPYRRRTKLETFPWMQLEFESWELQYFLKSCSKTSHKTSKFNASLEFQSCFRWNFKGQVIFTAHYFRKSSFKTSKLLLERR